MARRSGHPEGHDADVLLVFVRTDPEAPKHKGISAFKFLKPTLRDWTDGHSPTWAVLITLTSTRCSSMT
ncbi:MAG: hypothetical protein CM1200mP26_19610 [Acidimicrobiales bacterium]|nr:MAG: hypothetical protein CM1200mP26_19610 [Acidimicrobiales bacterium]